MTANILNLRYFILLFLSTGCLSQELEVSIRTNKTDYQRNDSIYISTVFKNVSGSTIKFLTKGRFETGDYCFTVHPVGDNIFNYLKNIRKEDFVTLESGAEYVLSGYYNVFWPCRGMPPKGNWNLDIRFVLNITPNENKYYVIEGEEIIDTKQVTDAWTGNAVSDPVSIVIKRPE